jgi:hypothetical protein
MTDFALGSTFDKKFTTRTSAGVPSTLGGTPVISAYPDNSTTQITAGITLSVDFDSLTGLNNIRVVATSGNGYVTGTSYALVITTGTVDSVSVVGEVVGEFTLDRGAAAVKTKTDQMVFTTANLLDVRVNNIIGKTLGEGGTGNQGIGEA